MTERYGAKDIHIQKALERIEKNGWIDVLKQYKELAERYQKLMDLLPETIGWDIISARKLVFCLQKQYDLDFGVCSFYTIKTNKQYCIIEGEEIECLCAIPQAYCVLRDKDGTPKYPKFLTPLLF